MDEFTIQNLDSLFRAVLESSPDGIVFLDSEFKIKILNRVAENLLGVTASEACGRSLGAVLGILDGFDDWLQPFGIARHGDSGDKNSSDKGIGVSPVGDASGFHATTVSPTGGTQASIEVAMVPFSMGEQAWYFMQVRDPQPRQQRERELEHAAVTDHLSQLHNRRGFQQALEANMHRELALAILDIDWFKRINDQYGHLVGDQAIQFVSEVLTEQFSDACCVARLGGDEFGIVLEADRAMGDVGDTLDALEERFERLRRHFETHRFGDSQIGLTVSIGVALVSPPDSSARKLLGAADHALYQAKNAGRNQVRKTLV